MLPFAEADGVKALSPSVRWDGKLRFFVLIGLVAGACALYLWRFDSFQVGTYMDDAQYVVLAESLAQGAQYGLVNQPSEVLPTRYPFGWPLLLSPIYALFGGDFQPLKMVSLLLTLGGVVVVALGWRQLGLLSPWIGIASAGLFAFSPLVVGHARMVMSEPAFLFVVLLALA